MSTICIVVLSLIKYFEDGAERLHCFALFAHRRGKRDVRNDFRLCVMYGKLVSRVGTLLPNSK